jgi:hypothetical protein
VSDEARNFSRRPCFGVCSGSFATVIWDCSVPAVASRLRLRHLCAHHAEAA